MEEIDYDEKVSSLEDESIENNNSEANEWNINILEQKNFYKLQVFDRLIYKPEICPCCKKGKLSIYESQNIDIINPFNIRCNSKTCKKKYNIRKFSFFKLHPKIPISIMIYIIELFITFKNNAKQIKSSIDKKYKINFNYSTLLKILNNIRFVIAEFLKDKYKESELVVHLKKNKIVAMDEKLFLHDEFGNQIWFVGACETDTCKIRIDVINERNALNLKKFTVNHIEAGTTITHDGWPGYSFLNDDDSVWEHEVHNHGHGDFGYGRHSTSHIEHTWNNIVQEIKIIYGHIPSKNYIYFIREGEFRLNICKKTDEKKLNIFYKILKHIYELCEYEFSSVDDILNFDNYDF